MQNFISGISNHKAKCIEFYCTDYYSETRGQNINHHINKLTNQQQIVWDGVMYDRSPEIYEQYLTRYKTA